MPKKSASPAIQSLQVSDGESLNDFLREAKRVWLSAHPEAKKKRGAPSLEQKVFKACDAILLGNGSSNKPLTTKNRHYPFTSASDWVEAIKQRLNLTTVNDPERTIKKHFQTWLLSLDEKLADLPSSILFYVFKINPVFLNLKALESCRAFRDGTPYPQSIPESVKLISRAIVKLRPYFTLKELYDFGCAGFSLEKITSMIEAGNSREKIIKIVKAEDPKKFEVAGVGFWPPYPGHKNIGLRVERSPKK